ncbi:MAG TPA: hypothetical protein VFW29_06015 [Solirubrobacteraceae bacterium]|nr:hypothetical protein [Solirubrobacteraceae bacterium]
MKTALGLAAAICLLGALAAPALAHEFVATKTGKTPSEATPFKTKAVMEEGQFQTFVLAKRTIKCEKAVGKDVKVGETEGATGGIVESPTKHLQVHLTMSKCGYYPQPTKLEHFPAALKGGININFDVNGSGEFEGLSEGEELEYGVKAELLKTAAEVKIGTLKFCTFVIPEQTIPARAKLKPEEEFATVSYSNEAVPVEPTPTKLKLFPDGFQHKLVISYDLKPFKFKYGEETQCAEDEEKQEFGNGILQGELKDEVIGGNLEFK